MHACPNSRQDGEEEEGFWRDYAPWQTGAFSLSVSVTLMSPHCSMTKNFQKEKKERVYRRVVYCVHPSSLIHLLLMRLLIASFSLVLSLIVYCFVYRGPEAYKLHWFGASKRPCGVIDREITLKTIENYRGGKSVMVIAGQSGMSHCTMILILNRNKVIAAVKGSASLEAK